MKTILNQLVLFLTLSFGALLGWVKGEEARQKWFFRIKSRTNEKKHLAAQKKLQRDGAVLLDDIEIASFHNN
jgi:hypothetical protein